MSNTVQALIIDDDFFNLEVIARLLKIEGIASTQAQNLQQIHAAIDAVKSRTYCSQ
jgi:CheY-like chemotaxis protein